MRGFGVTWPGTEHAHRLLNPRIFTNWGNQMRTIKQYLEAAKARKENGEAGFSLVELIVVVVILGILAAVAIPIFTNIQGNAEQSAADAAAANKASEIAARMASPSGTAPDPIPAKDGFTFEYSPSGAPAPATIDAICLTATKGTKTSTPKGPGCP